MTDSSTRRGIAASLAACALLAGAGAAEAAIGSIDFQEVKIGLSDAQHRPMAPVITVQFINGQWRTSAFPVRFELELRAKVNATSAITRIRVGVPGMSLQQNTWHAYVGGFSVSAREVHVTRTVREFPGDRLALVSLDAASRCAQAAPGKTGEFTLSFRIPVEVEVMAVRGIVNIETRTKVFQREIEANIRCVPLGAATAPDGPRRDAAPPQRTKGEPQRTKGEPQRTAPPFAVIGAELAFAKSREAGCPVEVRQSVRIISKGPGRAKFFLVKQDGKGTLSGPYYVDVKTYDKGVYVGVARVTNVFKKDFAGTYRVVVANESGKAFESGWVELKVECPGPAGKITLVKPAQPGAKPKLTQ